MSDDRPQHRAGPRRQALSEFVTLGACLGLIHAIVEIAVQTIWGVSLMPLDWLFSIVACSLVGLVAGFLLWLPGVCIGARVQSDENIESVVLRRRFFWVTVTILHTSLAGWILWDRVDGFRCATLFCIQIVAALTLCVLGYRQAGSFPRLLIAAVGVVCANIAVTTFPFISSDLPNTGRYAAAAGVLFLPAAACIAVLIGLKALLEDERDRTRTAFAGLGSLVGCVVILTLAISPLRLDWHVRDEPQASVPEKDDYPNTLLIVLDTVRADHLELFGYGRDTMPKLTEFAKNECHSSQAILATAPMTLPTHASMFTGQYSHTHGAHQPFLLHEGPKLKYGYALREDLPTLAQHLTGLGFRTAGIVGNYGVLGGYGLSRGFSHYDVAPGATFLGQQISWLHSSPMTQKMIGTLIGVSLPESVGQHTRLFDCRKPPYRRADEITDRAISWLTESGDQPFFLFVNYFDAHDPYLPVREVKDRFFPEGKHANRAGFIPDHMFQRLLRKDVSIPDAWREGLVSQYDAELFYLDGHLDRLLNRLRSHPSYDDTLIVITSDHGEAFLEHDLLRHGTSLFDTQIRVPLLVKFPKTLAEAKPVIPDWFQFVDLYPSVMSMLNETPPEGLAGSVWAAGRQHALSEVFVSEPDIDWLRREECAVMIGPYKYVRSTTGQTRLYNTSLDPAELYNLAGTQPEITAQAESIIDKRNAAIVRELTTSGEDAAMQQKLRSLGYLK